MVFFVKKLSNSRPLFCLFFVFLKQTSQILYQINLKKCPSSKRRWDSSPQQWVASHNHYTRVAGLPPNKSDTFMAFADVRVYDYK